MSRLWSDKHKELRKLIPYTWMDKPELFKEIVFFMIVNFVEGEECFNSTAYDDEEWNANQNNEPKIFADKLRYVYTWLKETRPKLQAELTAKYSMLASDKLEAEERVIVKWFAENHHKFWT